MWAHGDMKIQIPQFLGLTPIFGLDPFCWRRLWYASLRLRLSLRRDWGCGPSPSAGAFYAEARLLTIWSVRPNGLRLRQPFWPALGLRVSLMLACYAHTDGVEKQRIR